MSAEEDSGQDAEPYDNGGILQPRTVRVVITLDDQMVVGGEIQRAAQSLRDRHGVGDES